MRIPGRIATLLILSFLGLTSAFAASITIDASTLTEYSFRISDVTGCLDGSQVHTLTLDPGNYTFVGCSSGSALNFAVGQDGFIDYDPSLQGVMTGAGTSALAVNGFPITIDSTRLSQPAYALGVSACVDGTQVQTWNLLPASYSYIIIAYCSSAGGIPFHFTVDLNGHVTYDAALEAYLDGAGTSRLDVQGFEVTIDARPLWEGANFDLRPVLNYMDFSQAPILKLLPFAYLMVPQPGFGSAFYFEVDAAGDITYDPSQEGFLDGAGSSRLIVSGFPITLDVRTLTDALFRVGNATNCLNGRREQSANLIPGTHYFFTGCSGQEGFSFSVEGPNGYVDYSPTLDLVVGGRGTKRLVVLGARVIVAPDVGFEKLVSTPLAPGFWCAGPLSFTILPKQFSVCVSDDTCDPIVLVQDLSFNPTEINTPYGRLLLLLGPTPRSGDPTYRVVGCDVSEPAFIIGRVIVDLDESCSENGPDEAAVAGAKVRIRDTRGQSWYAWTDAIGQYVAPLQRGGYGVSLVHTTAIQETCNGGIGITHTVNLAPGATSSGRDFHVRYRCGAVATLTATYGNPAVCNGRPIRSACPTARQRYCADFRNAGTVPILPPDPQHPAGRLTIDLADPPAEFTGVTTVSNTCPTTSLDSVSPAPHLSWFLQSAIAPPGSKCQICVEAEIVACDNSYQPGRITTRAGLDAFCPPNPQVSTNFVPVQATTTLVDPKTGFPYEECKCSCDPNDKTVQPSGCGPVGFIGPDETLTYMLRFQNLGLTPALDIVIRDVLDPNLDPDTLEILTTSHPYTAIEILPNSVLEWSFMGINLPQSTQDELGSQGFILFRISPRAGVPDGTEFINSAAVFFDQNPPEITNETVNTVAPAQIADLDGDGFSPCQGDCNDLDPSVYPVAPEICDGKDNDCDGIVDGPPAIPGEVTGLGFNADKVTVVWDAGATAYDVVRGALNELPVGGSDSESCLVSGTAGTTAVDNSAPGIGSGFWYLVRARNGCGVGSYGRESDGSERSSATCP